jgi:SAM-dependent MidA family methyltransferase
MRGKPKKVRYYDKENNLKYYICYKYNEFGDAISIKRYSAKDELLADLRYVYDYDDEGRMTYMKIEDLIKGTELKKIFEY